MYALNSESISSLYVCPRLCKCNDLDGTGSLSITCSIPTINDLDFFKFETNVTSELNLDCVSSRRSHLEDRMFQHLYSFSTIAIRYCKFDFMSEQTLYGLYKLEHLTIDRATDLSIHEHSFINTPNLQILTIVNSGMTGFLAMLGLNQTEIINFTNNAIDSISDDNYMLPMKFERLRGIILNSNRIRKINITFSRMIPNLKYLLVADNMVSYISPNSLRNFTGLELLDFSKNNISTLDKSLLEDNTRLNVIKLGSNPITNIPEGFFRSTNQTEVLVLDSTSVSDFIWSQTSSLSSLYRLHVANCSLTFINSSVFVNLTVYVM